jgi:hypothetical protein
MMRAVRAAVNSPNRAFTCGFPAARVSNRAPVSIALNCVWFKALYISQRNWNRMASRTGKFLNTVRSQLLFRGPRIGKRGEFPTVPIAGIRTTSVRRLRANVRSEGGRFGSSVSITRAPSVGDPVMSTTGVVESPIDNGWPLVNP